MLVVDDEPRILRFVRVKMNLAGYEVITTTSGQDALELTQKQKPDIVLLDLLMVPLSGFDVLERLRTFSKVPVIVFTGKHLAADEVPRLGANDFIAKPFDPEELVRKVKNILDYR